MPPTPEPKDFDVLTDVAQLAALAHADRLAILAELVDEPRTGAQVAERLGQPAPRVHYHLKRLVENGLVVEVDATDKRFAQERYFRAVARHHLVQPTHGGTDERVARAVLEAFERVFTTWRRREILGVDLSAVARRVVCEGLGVTGGERILVVAPPQVHEVAEAIFLELEMAGARPSVRPWSRDYAIARLDRMADPACAELPFVPEGDAAEFTGVINVTSTQPSGAAPSASQRERLPKLLGALTAWQRDLRERRVPLVEVSVPVRGDVNRGDVAPEAAMELFWRAMTVDAALLAERIDRLVECIGTTRSLVVTDEHGGRLEFVHQPQLLHRNTGRLSDRGGSEVAFEEFPPGSLVLLAAPGTANGVLHLPGCQVGPVRARGVRLELVEGSIVAATAEEHGDALAEALANAVGDADALGELRIGVNPAGAALTGKASLDAVLEGAVTLAFGSNEVLGGSQSATLDLRFPSRASTVEADGRPLVRAGRLVL